MQTYSDYKNDAGLGFCVYSPYDDEPRVRRVSDCGGSEIWFWCDDQTAKTIDAEIDSDEQCGPGNDGPDGSDEGLTQFWRHVERIIRAHCKARDVWEGRAEMLEALAQRHEIETSSNTR